MSQTVDISDLMSQTVDISDLMSQTVDISNYARSNSETLDQKVAKI